MADLLAKILHAVSAKSYTPIKPKALFKRLDLGEERYTEFRKTVRELIRSGRLAMGRNNTLRAVDTRGTLTGVFRRTQTGHGFVRPHAVDGLFKPEVFVREDKALDAATGDEVLVRVTREATSTKDAAGEIVRVLERATRTFVGTYFERDGEAFVRVDGTVFSHSISVGDPGAKGAKPHDKVVFEMLRFPSPDDRGEGVITEVLGPARQAGRRYALGHPRLRPARRVPGGGAGRGAAGRQPLRGGRPRRPRGLHRRTRRHHRPGRRPRLRRRGQRRPSTRRRSTGC